MHQLPKHLDAETAERYLMGDCNEQEAEMLEEHLLVCGRCRARIARDDRYLAAMTAAAEEIRHDTALRVASRRLARRAAPVLGAAALLLLLVLLYFAAR